MNDACVDATVPLGTLNIVLYCGHCLDDVTSIGERAD